MECIHREYFVAITFFHFFFFFVTHTREIFTQIRSPYVHYIHLEGHASHFGEWPLASSLLQHHRSQALLGRAQ